MAESRGTGRLNILVICPELLKPDTSAGARRLFEILTILARRHSVDLYCPDWEGEWSLTRHENQPYPRQYREAGLTFLSGSTLSLDRVLSRRVYDVVLFEFWSLASWSIGIVRQIQPWAACVIDTVDVHFVREESGLRYGVSRASEVEQNKQREQGTYRKADALIAITPEDRGALEACGGMPPIFMIPIVVPVRAREDRRRGPEILFVGGFKHSPNVDGITWFVSEVWTRVREAVPEATLTVVGSQPPPSILELARLDGIEVTGFVPHTEPFLDRAAVSVAPLRFGGGMKGKVVEAMASGLAVVTTAVGAQGLGAVAGRDLIVADDPETFAREVAGLLLDPERAERTGRAGQDLAEASFSPRSVDSSLREILEQMAGRSQSSKPPGRLAWAARDIVRRLLHSLLRLARHGQAAGTRR